AGLDIARANPADFRLYYRGRELPFQASVPGGGVGATRPDDWFAFHAPGEPGEHYTEAFWLMADARPLAPTPPLRVEPAPAPSEVPAFRRDAGATVETRWFERRAYERKLRPELGFSRWHWASLEMGDRREFAFE